MDWRSRVPFQIQHSQLRHAGSQKQHRNDTWQNWRGLTETPPLYAVDKFEGRGRADRTPRPVSFHAGLIPKKASLLRKCPPLFPYLRERHSGHRRNFGDSPRAVRSSGRIGIVRVQVRSEEAKLLCNSLCDRPFDLTDGERSTFSGKLPDSADSSDSRRVRGIIALRARIFCADSADSRGIGCGGRGGGRCVVLRDSLHLFRSEVRRIFIWLAQFRHLWLCCCCLRFFEWVLVGFRDLILRRAFRFRFLNLFIASAVESTFVPSRWVIVLSYSSLAARFWEMMPGMGFFFFFFRSIRGWGSIVCYACISTGLPLCTYEDTLALQVRVPAWDEDMFF